MTLVLCVFMWAAEHVTASVWRSKDNLGEQLVLSPHQTDHGAQARVWQEVPLLAEPSH